MLIKKIDYFSFSKFHPAWIQLFYVLEYFCDFKKKILKLVTWKNFVSFVAGDFYLLNAFEN